MKIYLKKKKNSSRKIAPPKHNFSLEIYIIVRVEATI